MTIAVDIRPHTGADNAAIRALYPAAFPEEDLLPLVDDLLKGADDLLSLVAVADACIVGHIVFTVCGLADRIETVALLGPLAVTPARHGQGIGSALVTEGHMILRARRIPQVQVLGDPGYYGRFGFAADADVEPPYALPAAWRDAWQSVRLVDDVAPLAGRLIVPEPWRKPDLWTE